MTTKTPRIDLRLSEQSIQDVKKFRAELEATQNRAADLRQDMKQITDLLKSVRAREIFGRPGQGGVGSYLAGQQFLEGQRVNQMQRLGTLSGQVLENNRRTVALARQGLKLSTDQQRLQEAVNLNLRTQARSLNKITDLQTAKNKLAAAELRLGLETYNGNERSARSAQRIVEILKERIRLLQEEQREQARADRARAVRNNRMTDQQLVERQRAMTQQRLFGDGGAGLFSVQSGIMANYMIMNTARQGVSNAATFTVELDEALYNLQAITASTDGSMEALGRRLVQVAESTKFTAVEVANAAVTLGQAGLSREEIQDSIEAVTLLATATGTDLPRAVDIATSVLGVFSMESAQMADVANTMTEAVNSSKLNIEKLTLGLQYSGNIAAQSGVRFDELTAALGAMANAGIRSGSTLGTGMRQILISLQNPSGQFLDTLERLGLTMQDVDLRTKGLYGVMSTLSDAGFTAGDAIRAFEVRAAAAYNALANNLDQMIDLETSFQSTTAAARANETQMRALANQSRLFNAAFGALAATAFEPLKVALRDTLMWGAEFLSWLRQSEGAVQTFTTVVTSAAVAFGIWRFGKLIAGLGRLATGTKKSSLAITQWNSAAKATTSATGAFSMSLQNMSRYMRVTVARAGLLRAGFLALGGPLGMLSLAASVAVGAFFSLRNEAERTGSALDQSMTTFDDATGGMEQAATRVENVDNRLQELLDRYEILGRDSRLLQSEINSIKNQFWELGLTVTSSEENVDGLIKVLRELRAELQQEYVAKIRIAINGGRAAITALQLDQGDQFEQLLGNVGPNQRRRTGQGSNIPNRAIDQANRTRTQIRQTVGPLANGDASTDEARTVVTDLTEMLNAAREIVDDPNLSGRQSRIAQQDVELLAQALVDARQILGTIQNRESLEAEVKRSVQKERVESERTNPDLAAVFAGADEIGASLTNRFGDAARATIGKGAIAQYEAALQVRDDVDREVEALRTSLEEMAQKGLVSPENIAAVEQKLAEATGRVQADVAALADAAGKVEDELAQTAVRQAREKIRGFRSRINSASSENEISSLLKEQLGALTDYAEMRRAEVLQTVDDPDLLASALNSLELEISNITSESQKSANEAAMKIAEKASEDEAKRQRELADIDLTRAENHLDALEKQLQWAETVDEANAVYRQIIEALTGVTKAQSQVDALAVGDDSEVAAALAAQRKEETEAAMAEAEASLDKATDRISRRRSSGSGSRGDNDPVRRWVQRASTQLSALNQGMDDGRIELERGLQAMDRVFTEAESELTKVNSQMGALQSRLLNGQLTSAEQEKLNTLVERHNQLTGFIQQNEQQILDMKMRQGQVQESMNGSLEAWNENNLNLGSTLTGGMVNSLNTARSALSGFFSDWTEGTKKGGEAFQELGTSVLRSINRIFSEMMTVFLLQKAMGFLGVSGGSTIGTLFSSVTGIGLKEGGTVKKYNRGGRVDGTLQRDSVRADLMPDEYVLRASAAKAIGHENLDHINAMGNRATSASLHQGVMQQQTKSDPNSSSNINFYLVDDRSQIGSLGPQDVVAIVGDDIARGGTTKKLIKSVQVGAI